MRARDPDNRLGGWLRALAWILAIPLLLFLPWLLASFAADAIPNCDMGAGSSGTCYLGSADMKSTLMLLAAPFAFFAFLVPVWIALVLAWLAFGLVAISASLVTGRGFRLHRRWLLQGEDMKTARILVGTALAGLYVLWWLATL